MNPEATPGAGHGALRVVQDERRRFFRFVLAAGASVPVNIASRVVLSRWIPFGEAVLLAHVVGMLTAYSFSKIFVFDRSGRSVPHELARFALVNVVSASVTWAVSVGLVNLVFPAIDFRIYPELVAHIIGLGCTSVISFAGHRWFSFRISDAGPPLTGRPAVDRRALPARTGRNAPAHPPRSE